MDERFDEEKYYPFINIIDRDYDFPMRIHFKERDYLIAWVSHPSDSMPTLVVGNSEESAKRLHHLEPGYKIRISYRREDGWTGIAGVNSDILFRIIGLNFIPRKNLIKFVNSPEKLFTSIIEDSEEKDKI